MLNRIRDYFRFNFLSNLWATDEDSNSTGDESDDVSPAETILGEWRERLFFVTFLSLLVFTFIPFVQGTAHSYQQKNWTLLAIHSTCYFSVIAIVLFRRIPFVLRVLTGLLVLYVIGVTGLIFIGAESSGRIWLFSFSIIATLLLGLRAGLVSIALNTLTVLALGDLLSNGILQWPGDNTAHLKIWTITAVTFVFLNSVVTISLAVMVRALENNLVRSQRVAAKLREANRELNEAHQKREKLEGQLVQIQKMESVGRLAGGIAHDYNNISSIIIGYSELALNDIQANDPLHDNLMEILTAAKRSADITRQLLAFARQQTIAPKVLDLNDAIKDMLKMLRRLIGEDIDLAWLPGAELWQVKMDPSQVDQILANLCVNARDSIVDVGKVTIETRNISFDEDYCADHAGFIPGAYVLLAVSDNGCGMDAETLDNIFEPFFTTKGPGKGTGLGLATVYGVIRQNGGFIKVYSEPGHGTTFKIYFPRYRAKTETMPKKVVHLPTDQYHETILLVEDEIAILKMTTKMLETRGYKVVAASKPGEAIRLAQDHGGEIHLLVSDVVMPEMNGRDLAKTILSIYPNLKCLFMSGYTANVIAHHGVLDEGVNFIQKPFSSEQFSLKIREVLGPG